MYELERDIQRVGKTKSEREGGWGGWGGRVSVCVCVCERDLNRRRCLEGGALLNLPTLRHKITTQDYNATLRENIAAHHYTTHTTLLHSNTIHTLQLQHNITTQRYYCYCIYSTILENTLVDTSKRELVRLCGV
jgi:hypothetical protein